MTLRILFAAPAGAWQEWRDPLRKAMSDAGISADITTDAGQPVNDFEE